MFLVNTLNLLQWQRERVLCELSQALSNFAYQHKSTGSQPCLLLLLLYCVDSFNALLKPHVNAVQMPTCVDKTKAKASQQFCSLQQCNRTQPLKFPTSSSLVCKVTFVWTRDEAGEETIRSSFLLCVARKTRQLDQSAAADKTASTHGIFIHVDYNHNERVTKGTEERANNWRLTWVVGHCRPGDIHGVEGDE